MTAAINFAIIAGVLFVVVKLINRLKRQEAAAPAAPPAPAADIVLLAEIRDLLKQRQP
jgi:large conductance mechanosensitive channel